MKKILFSALGALALLTSCKKGDNTGPGDPGPSPTLLGKWQLDNYTVKYFRNGAVSSVRVVTRDSMATCALDDYWQYNADSSGLASYGKLCQGETVASEPFTWQLYGDFLVQAYANGRKEGMTISNITADYYTALDTLYPTDNTPDTGTILQQFRRID